MWVYAKMRVSRKNILFLSLLSLFLATTSASADFAAGVAAYNRGDFKTAFKEFRRLALQGNAFAQYNLGLMYAKGRGVAQDYAQAVTWYRKAALQGNALAQSNLGFMYENGRGVAQDYALAVKWYRKAALQGFARAQSNLGVMYDKGQGVAQDYVQAHMWFNLAASRVTGEKHKKYSDARDLVAK
ncbi:MAG: tetratricopeptide repeat protein, partial [Nitrospinota bacterium]|nr:tetratricopeptide repeat protein [Nitrospinota bacterium]